PPGGPAMNVKAQANYTLADELQAAEARYTEANPNGLAQWRRACEALPGGNTRTVLFYSPFPLTMARGEGAYLWDLDGHRYADFLNDFTAGLYGHSHPVIRQAMAEALEAGLTLGGHNRYEERLAALICGRFPSIELVRFTNSGTEASLMAVLTARAVTGRKRVLVFEGGYHGGVFYFAPGGSPLNLPADWLIGRYNDIAHSLDLIERNRGELAAILVEPMQGAGGSIPGDPEFLGALRDAATRAGSLLIFDEVMTSRLGPGGLQGELGVIPDMTVLGKYLGGGASFGAFGGRAEIMARFDPRSAGAFPHAGTFNNNVLSMAAGTAGLEAVFTPEAARELSARGEALRARLNGIAEAKGAAMQVTGVGSVMTVHFGRCAREEIRSVDDLAAADQDARALFHLEMLARGQYLARRGLMSLSLALDEDDLEAFAEAAADVLAVHGALLGGRD
ncbi:MAG: aminotransferase class III-fold pyridoxal phosphate-dependent enzyme, partial [Kiloniellales bacterium]|nr:aminotransferase class III-fold pyridoxal phosphate-dependent enzyme [Kiloniellales bacterium]